MEIVIASVFRNGLNCFCLKSPLLSRVTLKFCLRRVRRAPFEKSERQTLVEALDSEALRDSQSV